MSKLTTLTERAMDLVSQAGSGLRQVGPGASKLLQTGAAVGAVKTGGRVAVKFVRKNPVVAVAAALGVALDPAALARDLGTARGLGYEASEIRGFDLFGMTHHLEAVAILAR